MNLIEKLGLEKCKAIVDGAPEAFDFCLVTPWGNLIYYREQIGGFPEVCGRNKTNECVDDYQILYLTNLRTAIADHERTDHCSDIANHISLLTRVIDQ